MLRPLMLPLFDADAAPSIEGFTYRTQFLSAPEERDLLAEIARLDFGDVTFRGVVARRRVVQIGLHYSFTSRAVSPAAPFPAFLEPVRERAATLAGVASIDLAEALITEYQPGAGIGWHRDAPPFDIIVGVSLLSACRFRLRPRGRGRAVSMTVEPRSAYVLGGVVRSEWEHSIPPGDALRYSITFRTLRAGMGQSGMGT